MKATFNKEKNRFELNADYSLHCVSTDISCEKHTHEYIELVYCFSGTALNYVDDVSYPMSKGDMLLIDRHSTHAFYPMPRIKHCDIMLKPSFFDRSIDKSSGIYSLFELDEFCQFGSKVQKKRIVHFSPEDQEKVEFLIKATADELKHEKLADVSMKRSALCMLLTLVFRYMVSGDGLLVNGDLLSYVNAHCNEHLTAGILAERCAYSLEHFSRKFKKIAGKTFTQYLTECRLHKAREMLINSRKTVDVILIESGFTSRGEFFKKFEQAFGETPLMYRNNQKSVLKEVKI